MLLSSGAFYRCKMKLFRSVSFSLCLFPANYLSKTKENIREIHNESLNIEHSCVGLDKTRETVEYLYFLMLYNWTKKGTQYSHLMTVSCFYRNEVLVVRTQSLCQWEERGSGCLKFCRGQSQP